MIIIIMIIMIIIIIIFIIMIIMMLDLAHSRPHVKPGVEGDRVDDHFAEEKNISSLALSSS